MFFISDQKLALIHCVVLSQRELIPRWNLEKTPTSSSSGTSSVASSTTLIRSTDVVSSTAFVSSTAIISSTGEFRIRRCASFWKFWKEVFFVIVLTASFSNYL